MKVTDLETYYPVLRPDAFPGTPPYQRAAQLTEMVGEIVPQGQGLQALQSDFWRIIDPPADAVARLEWEPSSDDSDASEESSQAETVFDLDSPVMREEQDNDPALSEPVRPLISEPVLQGRSHTQAEENRWWTNEMTRIEQIDFALIAVSILALLLMIRFPVLGLLFLLWYGYCWPMDLLEKVTAVLWFATKTLHLIGDVSWVVMKMMGSIAHTVAKTTLNYQNVPTTIVVIWTLVVSEYVRTT